MAFFTIPGFAELRRGSQVRIADKQQNLFELRNLDNGEFALGFNGVPAKSCTLTLYVFDLANFTSKPDATVKLKVVVK
ncbi:MAG: hypothetical protein MJ061_05305 [Mailhella sp.]|nr:hypothetical protein [Mailhella sp.]